MATDCPEPHYRSRVRYIPQSNRKSGFPVKVAVRICCESRSAWADCGDSSEHELHIHPSFSSGAPYVELETAGGSSLLFKENAPSTTLLVYYYNNTPQTDYTLEFVGSWPANLPDVLTMSTQWRLHDTDDTTWLLQTVLDPGTGKYIVARPVSVTFRGGLTWTIAYGSYGEPSDIFSRVVREVLVA